MRSEALPDVPTVGQFVTGYEASGWYGISAPKGTSAQIVDKLNKEINAGLADPMMKARPANLGGAGMPMMPAEFGKFIADETEKWGKVTGPPTLRRSEPTSNPFSRRSSVSSRQTRLMSFERRCPSSRRRLTGWRMPARFPN
jgi:hypothetical protein